MHVPTRVFPGDLQGGAGDPKTLQASREQTYHTYARNSKIHVLHNLQGGIFSKETILNANFGAYPKFLEYSPRFNATGLLPICLHRVNKASMLVVLHL